MRIKIYLCSFRTICHEVTHAFPCQRHEIYQQIIITERNHCSHFPLSGEMSIIRKMKTLSLRRWVWELYYRSSQSWNQDIITKSAKFVEITETFEIITIMDDNHWQWIHIVVLELPEIVDWVKTTEAITLFIVKTMTQPVWTVWLVTFAFSS